MSVGNNFDEGSLYGDRGCPPKGFKQIVSCSSLHREEVYGSSQWEMVPKQPLSLSDYREHGDHRLWLWASVTQGTKTVCMICKRQKDGNLYTNKVRAQSLRMPSSGGSVKPIVGIPDIITFKKKKIRQEKIPSILFYLPLACDRHLAVYTCC